MKVPLCRIYSVGEITSWAKQFLNGLEKENLVEVTYETNVQRFATTSSTMTSIAFVENAPDMRQVILKLRQSGRSLLTVWFGKLFSKEDLAFALENRVYRCIENPRAEDKKVLEILKQIARAAEVAQQFGQHLHAIKAILLQGESETPAESARIPLLQDLKLALTKLERYGGAINEFTGIPKPVQEEQEKVPFHQAQGLGDALTTVQELERTGALWIRGDLPGQEGKVEFLQGKIVAASSNGVRGVKAIYRMFLWDEPRFLFTRIDPLDYVFEDHLNLSIKHLCAEGESLRQRFQGIRRDLPPPDLKIELEPSAIHVSTQLTPEDFSTLTSVVEFGNVSQVVDYNPLPDVIIYEALIRLRKNNSIRVRVDQ